MSTISNRFFVTAIEDGTTLHGSLNATKTLTQAYSGGNAVPDWTNMDEQPIIYLNLFSGSKQVTNVDVGSITWYYNNSPMIFTGGTSQGRIFQTTTHPDSLAALKIIKNIATADNVVDTHTVTCSGTYNGIEFSASIQIRVSVISNNGYFGVLDFKDGKSVFTDDTNNITINAHLYESGATAELPKGKYSVKWYLNDVEKTGQGGETDGNYYLKISASQVTDNAIVRASFLANNNVVYNTYVSIDDQTDPEYMYIQYNGANGQSATLRKDQSVKFDIWVGKMDNPEAVSAYSNFKIKLLDSTGNVYTGGLEGIPDVPDGGDGWRPLNAGMNFINNKASITITYDTVNRLGKSLTGIIQASETYTNEYPDVELNPKS